MEHESRAVSSVLSTYLEKLPLVETTQREAKLRDGKTPEKVKMDFKPERKFSGK